MYLQVTLFSVSSTFNKSISMEFQKNHVTNKVTTNIHMEMTHLLLKRWALRSLYPSEQTRLRILSDTLLEGTFLEDFWSLPFFLLWPLLKKLLEGGSLEACICFPFSMVLHLSRPRRMNSLSNATFSWKQTRKFTLKGITRTKEFIRPWTLFFSVSHLFFHVQSKSLDLSLCWIWPLDFIFQTGSWNLFI